MSRQLFITSIPALALFLVASSAGGASLSGTIANTSAAGLSGMEVRLWVSKTKGYEIAYTATTSSTGTYTFSSVSAGTYKLDARMPAATSGYYQDRWYDVAPPNSSGLVGEDADTIVITASDALAGYNITLQTVGAITTTVTTSALASGIKVRAEDTTKYTIHHNDVSQASPHLGYVYLYGLVPGSYRILFHDPDAKYETKVVSGPYTVTASTATSVTAVTMSAMATDPYETNNKATDTKSLIDSTIFQTTPPGSYTTSGALIGPRNTGDLDWACFDAKVGDRFLISVDMPLVVDSTTREDPWVDPILAFYSVPSSGSPTKLLDDDDSGPGLRDAYLDTKVIATAGRYCAVVSTYGDTAWAGLTQGSAGRYRLTIKMGNREPKLEGNYLTSSMTVKEVLPVYPKAILMQEGEKVHITLEYSDPDADTLTIAAAHTDASATAVTNGTLTTVTSGSSTYDWAASQSDATNSPFKVVFTAKDAEFTTQLTTYITVQSQNLPPSVPTPISPPTGTSTTVTTATPALLIGNSTDPDGDTLTYDFEVYYTSTTGSPAQSTTVAEGSGGQTSWTIAAVSDNTWVLWRARAYDGQTHSLWSGFLKFFINTKNDPPTAPVLVKPYDGEVVMVQRPTLSVNNPTDPDETGILTLWYQVATDSSFTQGLIENTTGVNVSQTGGTTAWTVTQDLDWGGTYYARAYAKDTQGASGPYSNVNKFTVTSSATDGGPDGAQTDAGVGDGSTQADFAGATDGPSSGNGGEEDGCNCAAAGSGGGSWPVLLLLALPLLLRRRRLRRR